MATSPIRLFEARDGVRGHSDRIDPAHLDIGHPISIYRGVEGAVQIRQSVTDSPENGEMCAEWAKPIMGRPRTGHHRLDGARNDGDEIPDAHSRVGT